MHAYVGVCPIHTLGKADIIDLPLSPDEQFWILYTIDQTIYLGMKGSHILEQYLPFKRSPTLIKKKLGNYISLISLELFGSACFMKN